MITMELQVAYSYSTAYPRHVEGLIGSQRLPQGKEYSAEQQLGATRKPWEFKERRVRMFELGFEG